MSTLLIIVQLIVGLGIYNVWFLRAGRPTSYRGKGAPTLKQEFLAYGLPSWAVYVIGTIKVAAATALLVGIWFPIVVPVAATVLAVMMLGAVMMHVKVSDSFKRTAPALGMLLLCVVIVLITMYV